MNIEGRTEARLQLTTSSGEDERTLRHYVAPYTPGWQFTCGRRRVIEIGSIGWAWVGPD